MVDRREYLKFYFVFIKDAIIFELLSIPIRFMACCTKLNNRILAKIVGTSRCGRFNRVCKRSIRFMKAWQKLLVIKDKRGDKIDNELEHLDHMAYVLCGKHIL